MDHHPIQIPLILMHGLREHEVNQMSQTDLVRFLARHAEELEHLDPDKAVLQDFQRVVISREIEAQKESEGGCDSRSQEDYQRRGPPIPPAAHSTPTSPTSIMNPSKPLAEQLLDEFNTIYKSENEYNESYTEEELKSQLSPLLYSIIQSNIQEFRRDYAHSRGDPTSFLRISRFISVEHGKEKKSRNHVEPDSHPSTGMVTPNMAFLHD